MTDEERTELGTLNAKAEGDLTDQDKARLQELATKEGGALSPEEKEAKVYETEWDKQEKGEKADEGKTADQIAEEKRLADEKQAETDRKAKEDADARSKDHGSVESMEKALKDTKTSYGKLQTDFQKLQEEIASLKSGKGSQADVDAAAKALQDSKDNLGKMKEKLTKVYEDYPELKDVLDPLVSVNQLLSEKVETLERGSAEKGKVDARVEAKAAFERDVKPEILKTHSDFDQIVRDEAYWDWAAKQRPALRFAAENSPDPADINWALTEFKKSGLRKDVNTIKEKDEAGRNKKITDAMSLRGGASSSPPTKKKDEDKTYDELYDEAGEILKKKGIGVSAA